MLNINAYSGLGSIKVKPPSPPGSPIIAFLAENVTANAWANSGSGGATYNATAIGASLIGSPIGDFNCINNDFDIASEYVLPNTAIIAALVRLQVAGTGAITIGQKSATNGGNSAFYCGRSNTPAYGTLRLYDDAGNAITTSYGVSEFSDSEGLRIIADRTGATTADLYFNGELLSDSGVLSSSVRLGKIGTSYAGFPFTLSGSFFHEILVYQDRSIAWDQIDAYFKAKFMIP